MLDWRCVTKFAGTEFLFNVPASPATIGRWIEKSALEILECAIVGTLAVHRYAFGS